MALNVSARSGGEGKKIDPIPEGLYEGVCYLIADIGTHYDKHWDKMKHEVVISWEFPSERIKIERDGKEEDLPRVSSKTYTLNLGDRANLRKDLESWRGKKFTEDELAGFDLKNVLGVPAQLQIMHSKGKTDPTKVFGNITNILPSKEKTEPENGLQWFSLEEGNEIPDNIPKWIAQRIRDCEEFASVPSGEFDDNGEEIGFGEQPVNPGDLPPMSKPKEEDNLPF